MSGGIQRTALIVSNDVGLSARIARNFARQGSAVAWIDCDGLVIEGERINLPDDSFEPFSQGWMRAQLAELRQRSIVIDRLVHLSAPSSQTSILETGLDEFGRIVGASLTSAFVAAQVFAGEIVRSGGGSIVMVSMTGSTDPARPDPIGGACQASIAQLVRILTVDLANAGIRVNAVTTTDNVTDLDAIAWTAYFLASEEAAYIDGQIIAAGTLAGTLAGADGNKIAPTAVPGTGPTCRPDQKFASKVVLVVGGASGIGAAISDRLERDGAEAVIRADITLPADASADIRDGIRLDVGDAASIRQCVEAVIARYGRIDVLINSAGIAKVSPFLETTLEDYERIMAINFRGAFALGQAVARHMVSRRQGVILNVSSVSGMAGNEGRSAYGTSKAALASLSQAMARELAPFGIRVNVLAPGPILTPLAARHHNEATARLWFERVPLRRYGTPEEMASAAAFLCSDSARLVSGCVLAGDGGFLAAGLDNNARSQAGSTDIS